MLGIKNKAITVEHAHRLGDIMHYNTVEFIIVLSIIYANIRFVLEINQAPSTNQWIWRCRNAPFG